MYAIIHTRLDIVFALERLNQYFNDLAKHHEQTLKNLLRYIRFIIDYELKYNFNENIEFHKLLDYFDFNLTINKFENLKFILEYVYILVENFISWMSRK